LQAVTCRIAEQTYAVPLAAVLQVVRLPGLTRLAGAPPELCGLLNLRGAMVPVLAARVLVGAPADYGLDSHVMIVGDAAGLPAAGLLVDAVEHVRRFAADSVMPLLQGSALVCGVVRGPGEAVLWLDPEVLLAVAQRR
jgi:purine-binding chemotaxis protein CheW